MPRGVTVEGIARQIAQLEGLDFGRLRGRARDRECSRARLTVTWLGREIAAIAVASRPILRPGYLNDDQRRQQAGGGDEPGPGSLPKAARVAREGQASKIAPQQAMDPRPGPAGPAMPGPSNLDCQVGALQRSERSPIIGDTGDPYEVAHANTVGRVS